MNRYKKMMETQWLIAQGQVHDRPIIARCVSPLERQDILPDTPWLVVVYWEYEGDASGLPLPAENGQMEVFERRLSNALGDDSFGAMVGVQTVNGRRTFIFYVRDVDGFQEHLVEITDDLENPWPIQIEFDEDPEWNFFFEHIYLEQQDAQDENNAT